MRIATLSILLIVGTGVGSASAQEDNSYELGRIARSLDNIDWELWTQNTNAMLGIGRPSDGIGGGIGYYGGGLPSGGIGDPGGYMVYKGFYGGVHRYEFKSYADIRAKSAAAKAKAEAKRAKYAARRAKARG